MSQRAQNWCFFVQFTVQFTLTGRSQKHHGVLAFRSALHRPWFADISSPS